MPSQDVCPSVTRRYSVETVIDVLERCTPSSSHAIPVFSYQTVGQYSDGTSLTEASSARGMKNPDFRPISRFASELIQDRSIFNMEGE